MIVVIDGPAGSGKSSTAKAVAGKLGIQYLDSGALYRVATLVYLQSDHDRTKFFDRLKSVNISFHYSNGFFSVTLNGKDVSEKIRSLEVSNYVSEVASDPEVRTFVNHLMNKVVHNNIYIADGRDLGTAVFPNADMKFFMVADLETRARRRLLDMKEMDSEVTLEQIRKNIAERDDKDSNRDADPLKKAPDAIEIDTGTFTFEEQVDWISERILPLLSSTN